jgi:ubiquinone/menaquinone biosynthesis C-methylase UbiE
MLSLKGKISRFDAGSLLDVAVGRGDFLKFAIGAFRSWKNIAAIDIDSEVLQTARHELSGTPVTLILGSGLQMPFMDDYFDTITISNALHHIEDLPLLFSEMARVCKTNGLVIINEMLNEDNQNVDETYMLYHKFISDIDHQQGRYHRDTFSLKEMQMLIKTRDFGIQEYFIHAEETGNIMNDEEIEAISERLRKKVSLLRGSDYYYFYENKAREIIQQFTKKGIHMPRHATFLLRAH